jgi:hypothetical protein
MSEIDTLIRWLEIKQKFSTKFPGSISELKMSIYKSSLLPRLLQGKEPLAIPPPKSYSQPWYSLIEEGCALVYAYDFFFPNDTFSKFQDYPFVMISQFPWEILIKYSDEKYALTYWYQENNEDRQAPGQWYFTKIKGGEDSDLDIWELRRDTFPAT